MKIDRRTFSKFLLSSAAVPLLPSVAGAQQPQPRRGGTAVFVMTEQPPTLISLLTSDISRDITAKTTEGLLEYDFDLTPKPQLAQSWTVSPDGLRYVFNLRRGVKWHDGRDFVSEDVARSISIVKQYHPRGRATFANLSEIQTPDAHTVVLILSKPAPYLLHALPASEVPIVAAHIYKEGADPATNPNNVAPIGTGPFVFKEWVRGSHILLERNPNYWDEGKPYLDRLVVRTITDAGARAAAFETGEVHVGGAKSLPLGELKRLMALPSLKLETRGKLYDAGVNRIEFNLDSPIFSKLEVRQAFAHAIDKQAVLDLVYYGYGKVIHGPISPDLAPFYVDDLPRYEFDLKKAEALLDAAGYPRGSDGTRFSFSYDPRLLSDEDKRTADYIRSALAKIGVRANVRGQDFATYIKRVYTNRDFEMISNGITNSFDPTLGVQRLYWSKNFKPGVPFSNGTHYNNPEVDRLLESAAVEIDPKKRFADFKRFQELVVQDLPEIPLVSQFQYTIYNLALQNHTTTATGINGNFADAFLVSA